MKNGDSILLQSPDLAGQVSTKQQSCTRQYLVGVPGGVWHIMALLCMALAARSRVEKSSRGKRTRTTTGQRVAEEFTHPSHIAWLAATAFATTLVPGSARCISI